MERGRLTDPEVCRAFLLAGHARLTLASQRTGARYTFEVVRAREERNGRRPWFVRTLVGADNERDYVHLAIIGDHDNERLPRRLVPGRHVPASDKRLAAFAFLLRCLDAGRLHADLEVWHEGRCGRCGRTLTVPSSVATGLGPECAQRMAG